MIWGPLKYKQVKSAIYKKTYSETYFERYLASEIQSHCENW